MSFGAIAKVAVITKNILAEDMDWNAHKVVGRVAALDAPILRLSPK
jgi:hypothetical protein